MEELLEIKHLLQNGKVNQALSLVDELEGMSRSNKINQIDSYGIVLLSYLIREGAGERSRRSWEVSIRHAVREIQKANKRYMTGGCFFNTEELLKILTGGYDVALERAALEVFEGRYEAEELAAMVNRKSVMAQAATLLEQAA